MPPLSLPLTDYLKISSVGVLILQPPLTALGVWLETPLPSQETLRKVIGSAA